MMRKNLMAATVCAFAISGAALCAQTKKTTTPPTTTTTQKPTTTTTTTTTTPKPTTSTAPAATYYITVTVTDQASGKAIAGATVTATNYSTHSSFTGSSRSAGSYTVSNVPAGSYTLSVSAPGYANKTAGVSVSNAPASAQVALVVGTPTASPVPGGTATGGTGTTTANGVSIGVTVKDSSTGAGISGASVRVVNLSTVAVATGTTASSGTVSIGNLPASTSYRIDVSATGYTAASQFFSTTSTSGLVQFALVKPPPPLTGTVVLDNAAATPVAGVVVQVAINGDSSTSYKATTDSNGKFSFTNLHAGNYVATVASITDSTGGTSTTAAQYSGLLQFTMPSASALTIKVSQTSARLGSITGAVQCKILIGTTTPCKATAVSGAKVSLLDANGGPVGQAATTTTGTDGRFTIQNVPIVTAGTTYTISVASTPDTGSSKESITVKPAPSTTYTAPAINVRPIATGTYSGSVQCQAAASGTGPATCKTVTVSGATVTLSGTAGATQGLTFTATTAMDGTFTVSNVTAGDYQLSVSATTNTNATALAKVSAPSTGTALYVYPAGTSASAPALSSISGVVQCTPISTTNPDNPGGMITCPQTGVSGAVITLTTITGAATGLSTTTANDGTFTITRVPVGSYKVTVSATASTAALPFPGGAAAPSSGLKFKVDAIEPLSTITGTVKCQQYPGSSSKCSSTTVGGVSVSLADLTGNPLNFSATADGNGNFTISKVPAGSYSLVIAATANTASSGLESVMAPSSGGSFYVYPAASMGTITGTAVCQMPPYNSSMSCNEGLANATVFVWPTSGSTQHYYGTISPNGNFVIKNVPTGNYYIMIEGMSQDPGPQGVTVTSPNSGGNFVWYP